MLSQYYRETSGTLSFSREQGSNFAKKVANDFNPLHNVDSRRFCVPGDLLFSIAVKKYGISRTMKFDFVNMVTENVRLVFPEPSDEMVIGDGHKTYFSVKRSGEVTHDPVLLENIINNYVTFSGHAFQHVVVPVMAERNVVLNPARPMVMYRSMSIELDRLDLTAPAIDFSGATFEYEGKRGSITLPFGLVEDGETVGRGEKYMLISGIREYNKEDMDVLIRMYSDYKSNNGN